MRNRMILAGLLGAVVAGGALVSGLLLARTSDRVAFPAAYRSWTHVKSAVILEGHANYDAFGGIHHVYANHKAVAALKAGTPFQKGAVLVFDLLEEQIENGAIIEGSRKVIGVMEKDPDRFGGTEGWGFEDFKQGDPEQPSVTNMREQCLSCHAARQANDYVYSVYRP